MAFTAFTLVKVVNLREGPAQVTFNLGYSIQVGSLLRQLLIFILKFGIVARNVQMEILA